MVRPFLGILMTAFGLLACSQDVCSSPLLVCVRVELAVTG